jgi:dihydrofolate synthase/folylpolyglutamate synthase
VENRKQTDPGFPSPTFFETLFLMAMVVFEKEKPDIIILETGLGGRKDATNVVSPTVTVIAEIGLDHCEYLGDTKEKIAGEKAGIIKEGIPVVFAEREKETADVIRSVAKQKKASVFPIGKKEYRVEKSNQKYVDFSFHSRYYNYVGFTLPTSAVYQAENASLALRAYEVFCKDETGTPEEMQKALWKTKWAGRMEEVLPHIYVDGAHNTDGILAFLDTVRAHGNQTKNYLIFAVMADKEYQEMIRLLAGSGLFQEILITGLAQKRALPTDTVREVFAGYAHVRVKEFETPMAALKYVSDRKDKEDYLYIAGSLYLAGDMLPLLKENFYDQF